MWDAWYRVQPEILGVAGVTSGLLCGKEVVLLITEDVCEKEGLMRHLGTIASPVHRLFLHSLTIYQIFILRQDIVPGSYDKGK